MSKAFALLVPPAQSLRLGIPAQGRLGPLGDWESPSIVQKWPKS